MTADIREQLAAALDEAEREANAGVSDVTPGFSLRLVERDRLMLADHQPYTDEEVGGRLCSYDGFGWPCDEVERAAAFWLGTPDKDGTDG